MRILPTMLTLGTMFDSDPFAPTVQELARRLERVETRLRLLENPPTPIPPPAPPRELWTRRQAAAHHGVTTRTIQTWEQDHGLVPTVRTPQGVLYDPETVRRFEPPSVQRRTPPTVGIRFCGEPCPRT